MANSILIGNYISFRAEVVYQNMKSVYGSHTCFLLKINSRQKKFPNAEAEKMNFSDPWSPHIYPFSDDTFVSISTKS